MRFFLKIFSFILNYSTKIQKSQHGSGILSFVECSVTIVVRLKKKNNRKSDWILLE